MPSVSHPRRLASSLLAAMLTTLLAAQVAVAAPPGSSGVVSRFSDYSGFSYYDAADDLSALGGPPPEQGCLGQGFDDPALVTLVEEPSGALKLAVRQGPTPVFVYQGTLDEICGTIVGGGSVEPLYVGWMSTVANDNDVEVTMTRVDSWGFSSHGVVWDTASNQCAFSAHARMQVTRDDEFVVRAQAININC